MSIIKKATVAIRREFYRNQLCRENKNHDFTLLSQNCIGGVIYHDLKMPFLSPTINMFIEDENFVKLVENPEHYLSVTPVPLTENYIDPIDPKIHYPKIRIDDIEICCLHYASCAEAIEIWIRRAARVNFNNIFVIANSWNMHGKQDLIQKVCENGKYKTICFTYGKYNIKNCQQLQGDFWKIDNRGIVRPNLTDVAPHSYKKYFEQQFDFIKWLNT